MIIKDPEDVKVIDKISRGIKLHIIIIIIEL